MPPASSRPVRTVAPAAPPVSLTEVKAHLRVETSDEDADIGAKLSAAVAKLDGRSGVLGRCLVTQTWRQDWDSFPPDGYLWLPFPDVQSVAVSYIDAAGETQTLSSALYHLVEDDSGAVIIRRQGASWPSALDHPAAVSVTMVAGFGAAADVPADIKHAIMLMVGDMYRHRETAVVGTISSAVPMSATVQNLINSYRWVV